MAAIAIIKWLAHRASIGLLADIGSKQLPTYRAIIFIQVIIYLLADRVIIQQIYDMDITQLLGDSRDAKRQLFYKTKV